MPDAIRPEALATAREIVNLYYLDRPDSWAHDTLLRSIALALDGLMGERDAAREIVEELARARAKHPPMHSAHEGWAVIFEELDELWDEVRAQQQDKGKMRKEALQVAAMALRFIKDICDA